MIFHISRFKRADKDGLHAGGVEKFAMYLGRAVELRQISWLDYPNWIQHNSLHDYDKALTLNEWLLESGTIGKEDVAIVDGYWGLGLEGKVARLISVCHGSYFGRLTQAMIYPWGGYVEKEDIDAQEELWRNPSCEIVCVAQEGVRELEQASILTTPTVIYHGIDLDVYKPLGKERKIIMHAATSARKGADLIKLLKMPIEPMNEYSCIASREASRLNDARFLVAPTRHEGNSYLLIEALACGTPLITYTTGLAVEMSKQCGYITDDLSPYNLTRLITSMDESRFNPRGWAEEYCRYEDFEKKWREYLEYTD